MQRRDAVADVQRGIDRLAQHRRIDHRLEPARRHQILGRPLQHIPRPAQRIQPLPRRAALPDGRLLLSDPARSTFWLLTAQGQPTGQFAYAGQLDLPTGIAALEDAEGILIAVSDTRRCSVSLWRLGDQG